jgi:hypothetical protein
LVTAEELKLVNIGGAALVVLVLIADYDYGDDFCQ